MALFGSSPTPKPGTAAVVSRQTYGAPVSGRKDGLQNPYAPSRTGPLSRLRITPAERHKLLYRFRQIPTEFIRKSALQRYRPSLWGTIKDNPDGFLNNAMAKREAKRQLDFINRRRFDQITPIKLVPGMGGVDYARAPRIAPGRPNLRRGVIRDVPPPVFFGRRPGNVPVSVQDNLARARTLMRGPYNEPIGIANTPQEPRTAGTSFGLVPMLAGIGLLLLVTRK